MCVVWSDVDILDFGEMVESGQNVANYIGAPNAVARNYYQAVFNENETMDILYKDRDAKDHEGTKHVLKIIGWVLIFADVVGFLIGEKTMVAVFTAVILIWAILQTSLSEEILFHGFLCKCL